MNKVYIKTNGCVVLRHETERIAKFFRVNNYKTTTSIEEANILIMTCCGVTHNEEDQAIGMIKEIENNRSKESVFIISGCLPAFAQQRILEVSPNARLMTYQQLSEFDDLIKGDISIEQVYYNVGAEIKEEESIEASDMDNDKKLAAIIDKQFKTTLCRKQYDFCTMQKYVWQSSDVYQIKVSYGCPGHCSYCATKLAIGNFKSVPKKMVLKQFQEGMEAGYTNFMMVGDEIGSYGSDFGENIIDLLNDINKLSTDIRIAIRYIHPDIFVKYYSQLKPFFAKGFIYYFCSAIQSAGADVLKRMNRNPDMEPFIHCMEDLNKEGYPVNKHTQILVGFPGETESDVFSTLRCLIRCNFDHININKYSPRRGTKAFDMLDSVPEEQKVIRCSMFKEWMMLQKKGKLYDAVKHAVTMYQP